MEMLMNMGLVPGMKEHLCSMLNKRAEEDELFAKSYLNSKKSIEECIRFIMVEAAEKLKDVIKEAYKNHKNCMAPAWLPDEWILERAIHYFDEEDLVVKDHIDESLYKDKSEESIVNIPKHDYKAPVIPIIPKKPEKFGEDSLFFGMDDMFEKEEEITDKNNEEIVSTINNE